MRDVIWAFKKSRVLSLGLLMLILALLLSGTASFVVKDEGYAQSGELKPGEYSIGNGSIEEGYLYPNRTLVLTANNATLMVSAGKDIQYNLTGKLILHPEKRPKVIVYRGRVDYTYSVKALSYPYSSLSIPALILAVTGSVLMWIGYVEVIRDIREGRKNEKA